MSILNLERNGSAATGHKAEAAKPTATRRRPPAWLVGLAVALLSLGVFVFLTPTATRPEAVLVLRQAVPAGQGITAPDLGVVSVSLPRGLRAVPATDEAAVVGQQASTDLAAGSLLNPGSYGASAGTWSEVGVSLRPGQYPPGLAAGEVVEAVVGPAQNATTTTGPGLGIVLAPAARVVSVAGGIGTPGTAMVGLDVAPGEALALAEYGAAGAVLLVVESR